MNVRKDGIIHDMHSLKYFLYKDKKHYYIIK